MKATAQLAISFLFSPGLLLREQEQHCPHLGDQKSSRINYLVSMLILNPIKLTIKIRYHN